MNRVELNCRTTQNREPYVRMAFGVGVVQRDADAAQSLCHGFGLSTGHGTGFHSCAVKAAQQLARRLRRLGWSVSIV